MRSRSLFLLAAVAVATGLGVSACGDDGGGDSGGALPVVIDSDGAFDDLEAVTYLLGRDDVDVLALTMSGTGVARCPAAAENFSAVLERVEAPDIPVACGRNSPIVGFNTAPTGWRDHADTLGGVTLPDPRELAGVTAPELFVDTVASAGADVTVVALGPLTNLAEAIESDPGVVDHIAMVYLMGGAVDVGGNVGFSGNEVAEFNIWADPRAAVMVFDSGVPITLVPLDATNDVPVTPAFYEAMASHHDATPAAALLAEYLDNNPLTGGSYQWDALAAVVATDESVATFEDRTLAVVDTGGIDGGAVVESTDGRPVRTAVAADPAAFESRFYESLLGTSDPGVAPWEPDGTVEFDGTVCEYEGPDPLPDVSVVQIHNRSDETMFVITGTHDPGTTEADLDAWLADQSGEPPWWTSNLYMIVPHGADDVWVVEGGPDVSAVCFDQQSHLWELVGPTIRGG